MEQILFPSNSYYVLFIYAFICLFVCMFMWEGRTWVHVRSEDKMSEFAFSSPSCGFPGLIANLPTHPANPIFHF